MIILEKRKSIDLLSGQEETLVYYPQENVIRWKSTAKYERLNWDVYMVAFPELKEHFNFDRMVWAGPDKAWHSSDVTSTQNMLFCYDRMRKQKHFKTKQQALKSAVV